MHVGWTITSEGAEQVIGLLEYVFLFAGVVDKVTREILTISSSVPGNIDHISSAILSDVRAK